MKRASYEWREGVYALDQHPYNLSTEFSRKIFRKDASTDLSEYARHSKRDLYSVYLSPFLLSIETYTQVCVLPQAVSCGMCPARPARPDRQRGKREGRPIARANSYICSVEVSQIANTVCTFHNYVPRARTQQHHKLLYEVLINNTLSMYTYVYSTDGD